MKKSVNKLLEDSFKLNWERPALSDHKGDTLYYKDVATRIEKLHIVFETCNLKKGDKVAVCSRNQLNWGVTFLAVLTYGAVPVPILHEFKPGNIHYLVNHSDSRILFAGSSILENLNGSEMSGLEAIIKINDFTITFARDEKVYDTYNHIGELFASKYPKGFTSSDLHYYEDSPQTLALINYTSGTSGFSKGVMIPYRALYSNILFAGSVEPHMNNTSNVVAMLPSAHMYGMMFEFLFEMTIGAHVHFLTRVPSPKIILEALAEIKPDIIISVPLVIEKIYKKMLLPFISKNRIKMLLTLPVIDQMIQKKIQQNLVNAFGGKFKEVIIGGAAFNKEAEAFFKRINFPFTIGYGMTECAPIITYVPWNKAKLYSCGKAAPRMEIKIDSKDPKNIPGEILVKGDNVFLGYYKNKKATEEAFYKGWFKTGDIGVMDSDGYLFLKGRNKSMILGPSGQNIYPEEIESSINNLPYVIESLVIEDKGALTALIYPDLEQAEEEGLSQEQLMVKLKEGIEISNLELPNYCKIVNVEIFPEEFEKTPKRSIKRYLYQRTQI
ncbi:MAG: AMP-binding protein [Bacteroidales bacterium]|nr:AMP-binding protein [Bacteroidales bacterium]MDD4669851.1 AMP-binding protein [Bacteroidales bacterium]